jgi:hypothetical protein
MLILQQFHKLAKDSRNQFRFLVDSLHNLLPFGGYISGNNPFNTFFDIEVNICKLVVQLINHDSQFKVFLFLFY